MEGAIALTAFRHMCEHARKKDEIRGRKVGIAAWESFLHHLERDDFSGLSRDELADRFAIYCDALCQIYARMEPLPYYRSLAERYHEWRDALQMAIAALEACAAYGGFLWTRRFTFDEPGFEKLRSQDARKILSGAGREAMEWDIKAVEQFERILAQ